LRILVCVPGVPHRSRGASAVLFYHYIAELKRAGFQLFCILMTDDAGPGSADLAAFRAELEEAGRCEVALAIEDRPIRFARYSGAMSVASPPADVAERARRFNAQYALFFDLGTLALCGSLAPKAHRAVWLGDLNFQTFWLHAVYDARERAARLLKLPKMWLICQRWRGTYRRLLRTVDRVFVASASSVDALRPLGVNAAYCPYPWPIEKSFRERAAERAAGEPPRFLFCGTLTGLGSRSALHYLLEALYPELVRRLGPGGFQILVTGARALAPWAQASIRAKPEIVFEGFVDDLYARMDVCDAAIVPIDVPVGNRSRIVTAMGYGLAVIAHPNTALGNPDLVSGETCLLAATPEEFASAMIRAHQDRDLAARIERSARRAYENAFEPRRATELLVEKLAA
jgi:glycosyltransferase involved in cell wall biosynthesis